MLYIVSKIIIKKLITNFSLLFSFLFIFLTFFEYSNILATNALPNDQYLSHYWPIFNNNMSDLVGIAHMIQGAATTFVSDRFGNPNSALNLNGGWTEVASGVYFETPHFTIAVWVFPLQIGNDARVIDFSNGAASDNIVLALSYSLTANPYFQIFNGGTDIGYFGPSQPLTLGKWQFLAATFNGTNKDIYLDGNLILSMLAAFTPSSLIRTKNYIGKSSFMACCNDGFSFSYLDDLRFYSKSLSQSEIIDLMNYQACKIFYCFVFNLKS